MSAKHWPGECDDEVPGPFVTIPPQPKEKKPGQQLKHYFDVVSHFIVASIQKTYNGMNPCH